eukprot:320280-Chlamydomonas_euryale.AAC.1
MTSCGRRCARRRCGAQPLHLLYAAGWLATTPTLWGLRGASEPANAPRTPAAHRAAGCPTARPLHRGSHAPPTPPPLCVAVCARPPWRSITGCRAWAAVWRAVPSPGGQARARPRGWARRRCWALCSAARRGPRPWCSRRHARARSMGAQACSR